MPNVPRLSSRLTSAIIAMLALALVVVLVTKDGDPPRLVAQPTADTETTTTTAAPPPPAPIVVTVPGPVQVVQVPAAPAPNIQVNTKSEAKVVMPPPPPPPPPPPAPVSTTTTTAPAHCDIIAASDTATVRPGGQVDVNALANDYDPCSPGPVDNLYLVHADIDKTIGTVNIESGLRLTYTAKEGFTGVEHFTYVLTNGEEEFATGYVTVHVTP